MLRHVLYVDIGLPDQIAVGDRRQNKSRAGADRDDKAAAPGQQAEEIQNQQTGRERESIIEGEQPARQETDEANNNQSDSRGPSPVLKKRQSQKHSRNRQQEGAEVLHQREQRSMMLDRRKTEADGQNNYHHGQQQIRRIQRAYAHDFADQQAGEHEEGE